MDTLGHPLALSITPATTDDRAKVGRLAEAVQAATGEAVEVAFADQGYTGERPASAAREHGITLEVVRLPTTLAGRHLMTFATLMGAKAIPAFDLVRNTL